MAAFPQTPLGIPALVVALSPFPSSVSTNCLLLCETSCPSCVQITQNKLTLYFVPSQFWSTGLVLLFSHSICDAHVCLNLGSFEIPHEILRLPSFVCSVALELREHFIFQCASHNLSHSYCFWPNSLSWFCDGHWGVLWGVVRRCPRGAREREKICIIHDIPDDFNTRHPSRCWLWTNSTRNPRNQIQKKYLLTTTEEISLHDLPLIYKYVHDFEQIQQEMRGIRRNILIQRPRKYLYMT